jgi:iron-sulfur cluster repair protein YtfE (RIC family)
MTPSEQPKDPDSIDDVLGIDHDTLGARLARLRAAIEAASSAARGEATRFAGDLRHHMTWEEVLLFPAAKARSTAAQRRSIESLEIDHERLRETLDQITSALAKCDFAAAGSSLAWLETLLKGHNYDEEHGVYVEVDRSLPIEERRRLLDAFRQRPGKERS